MKSATTINKVVTTLKKEKIITDEELIQLNIDLKLIHLKLLDPLYDYLYEIKIVLKKYNFI